MTVSLRVEEAYRNDVGKQIARIAQEIADQQGLNVGDIISIVGKRTTHARINLTYPMDKDASIIRLESSLRLNANVNLDDFVQINKTQAQNGSAVTLSPVGQTQLFISGNLDQYLSQALIDRILSTGDIVPFNIGFGRALYFRVNSTSPIGPIIFTPTTNLKIEGLRRDQKVEVEKEHKFEKISFEDIGGLDDAIRKIREMIELPLRHPELFERLGISPPKGVLLYGPPGTGKTLLAKAVATETSSNFITINGPEIISKYYGESENRLREIFEEANENAPTIIFIDEIDSIAPKRGEVTGETERRIVAQLLTLMDGLESRGQVVVIAATNRPESIDEALRRGGRFDREIEIGIPDRDARLQIFQIHTRGMPLGEDVNLKLLADRSHGYVGADIATLAKEAALLSLRRIMPKIDLSKSTTISTETLMMLNVIMQDFEQAISEIIPSAMREVFTEKPDVEWDDIGGLQDAKDELVKSIEWPIKFGNVFTKMKGKAPRGILLYGPPGTGKTMLAKAVANKTEANFISVKGPELFNKYVGESEKAIREIFRKARAAAPCVIFFDEIDSLASVRGMDDSSGVNQRVVSQLLTEMDGLIELKGVFVLAASNRPDIIDPALRRPGRFDKILEIPIPDLASRKEIFKAHLRGIRVAEVIDLKELSQQTEGYTGAEIAAIVEEARMQAIQEFIELAIDSGRFDEQALDNIIITKDHMNYAMDKIKPVLQQYNLKPPRQSSIDFT